MCITTTFILIFVITKDLDIFGLTFFSEIVNCFWNKLIGIQVDPVAHADKTASNMAIEVEEEGVVGIGFERDWGFVDKTVKHWEIDRVFNNKFKLIRPGSI